MTTAASSEACAVKGSSVANYAEHGAAPRDELGGVGMSTTINPVRPLSQANRAFSATQRMANLVGERFGALASACAKCQFGPGGALLAIAATAFVGCGDNRRPIAKGDAGDPDITVAVTRANLPISVTERGELEGAGAIE